MIIGLLFGSFNPVHIGHLLLATRMREHAALDEVWFVVSPHNPHKQAEDLAPEKDRLHMVQLALEGHPFLKVCGVEFDLPKPSYTVQTLEVLTRQYPAHQFKLIVGGDNLEKLHTWKNYDRIREFAEIVAYTRSGGATEHPDVRIFHLPLIDISATEIRERVLLGLPIRYFVPESVAAYIRDNPVYP